MRRRRRRRAAACRAVHKIGSQVAAQSPFDVAPRYRLTGGFTQPVHQFPIGPAAAVWLKRKVGGEDLVRGELEGRGEGRGGAGGVGRWP